MSSSHHPLAPTAPEPENVPISAVATGEYPDGAIVTVTGAASGITRKTTKQENPSATFQLTAEVLLAATRPLSLSVTGRLDRRGAVPALIATTIEEAPGTASRP